MAADVKAIYNLAFKVIDYCGDVEKGRAVYSEYFSPNNIRRLTIAPDFVIADYYISVPNCGKSKGVRIPSMQLANLEMQKGYVPIVQILASDRICSSVEEIIFYMRGSNGEMLNPIEYDMSGLTKGFRGSSGSAVGDYISILRQRFPRLKYVTRFNGNKSHFDSLVASSQESNKEFKSEIPEIAGMSSVICINDNDAEREKAWGSAGAARTYPSMDGIGGHLYNYFKTREEKRRQNEILSRSTSKDSGKYSEESKQKFASHVKYMKSIFSIHSTLLKVVAESYADDSIPCLGSQVVDSLRADLPVLYKVKELGTYKRVMDAPKDMSERARYEENELRIREFNEKATDEIIHLFLQCLQEYSASWGISVRFICEVNHFKTDISIPSKLERTYSPMYRNLGFSFSGSSFLKSCIDCSYNICSTFLELASAHSKAGTYDFWAEKGRVK